MIEYLDCKNCTQYGIDFTYKIIPKSLKPYKLMTIYGFNKEKNLSVIACLILFKYGDANSLISIMSLLRATFNFSPIFVTTDFDNSLQYALNNCDLFIKKPYVISCFFTFPIVY